MRSVQIFKPSIVLIFLFFFFPSKGIIAQQPALLEPSVKKVCNEVVRRIFQAILDVKEKYPELAGFNEESLIQNPDGIDMIRFVGSAGDSGEPAEFALTIVPIEEQIFKDKESGRFSYGFSLLRVKIAGYQKGFAKKHPFNLKSFVGEYGSLLLIEQQNYIPLRLAISSAKDVYHIGEDVEFTVTLTNFSSAHLKVKVLDTRTVRFWYGQEILNAKEVTAQAKDVKDIIIKAGESVKKSFRFEGFHQPRDYELFASYAFTYQGVNPTNKILLKVIK